MTDPHYYGSGFPYRKLEKMPGNLIVLEGTDGVGRSTQMTLLRGWLEDGGFAVSDTGLRRSALVQPGLDAAKDGHTMGSLTMSLFYATDFADRLENDILPALKAGFVVLSDRYFYSIIARDVVRGLDPEWARKLYGFALKPDIVIYLRADLDTLITRMANGRGFNYWEAGMDLHLSDNLYDSFCKYQELLIRQFDQMADEFNFVTIDADRPVQDIFQDIARLVKELAGKG
jgi:dTMP kinase